MWGCAPVPCLCLDECRCPARCSAGPLWAGHTLCSRCKPSLSTGPCHPSQEDVPEQVGDSSQLTLVFLPSQRRSFLVHWQQAQPRAVCGRTGSGRDRGPCRAHPAAGALSIWRAQLQGSSVCRVRCPAGPGSLRCLRLTSRVVTPAVTIALSSACDLRMQINDHSMPLDGYKWPLLIGKAAFPLGADCGGG